MIKRVIKPFISLLAISLIIDCHAIFNKNEVVYRTNGKMDSVATYLNDTTLNGYKKRYYSDGLTLKDSVPYFFGKKRGKFKSYFKDGKIRSEGFYKNDLQEGVVTFYYENGNIEKTAFLLNDERFGDLLFYDTIGKLRTYNCADFYQNVFCVLKFDEKGDVIKNSGTTFSHAFSVNFNNDSIPINRQFTMDIAVSNPPKRKVDIKIGEINRDGDIIHFENYIAKGNIIKYSKTFTEKGKCKIITVGVMHDINGNILNTDTAIAELIVR